MTAFASRLRITVGNGVGKIADHVSAWALIIAIAAGALANVVVFLVVVLMLFPLGLITHCIAPKGFISILGMAILFFGTALIAWLWYVLNTGPIVLF